MLLMDFCKATGLSWSKAIRLFNYPNREEYITRLEKKIERVNDYDWSDITMEDAQEAVEAEWLCRCLRELGEYRHALEEGTLKWERGARKRNEVEAKLNKVKGER